MYQLGIDIGSTTIKMALVNLSPSLSSREGEQKAVVVATAYERHNAAPAVVGKEMLKRMLASVEGEEEKISIAITGSVGMGYASRLGVPFVQEVVAAAEVVKQLYPEVHTLVDIGGEDSKMIFFEPGRVPDMRMNGNCAGGTGVFIDQTATLLGVDVMEINGLAAQAEHVYPIASRCGVFSKTDIQNLISRSVSKADIAASMLNAVSMQVVSALARGTEILPKVLLCGGPFAYIPELRKHLQKAINVSEEEIVVPEHSQFVPAIGTALLSAKGQSTKYEVSRARTLFDNTDDKTADLTHTLPPLFRSEEEYKEWLKSKNLTPTLSIREGASPLCGKGREVRYFLGVDSGSTTTKIVLLDEEGRLVYKDYSYNNGNSYTTASWRPWRILQRLSR